MDGHAEGDRPDLEHRGLDVVAEIGLRQHDRGLRAALPRRCQVALQAAGLEVRGRQGRGHEDGVRVRREYLLLRREPRLLAREDRPARQEGRNCRGLADADPVADRRPDLLMPKPPGQFGPELALLAVEDVGAAVLDRDARRGEPVLPVLLELCFALGRPPESHERFAQLDAPLWRKAVAGPRSGPPADVSRRERP